MEQTDAGDNAEPEQGALFEIETDEDDGCVWIIRDGEAINLGPAEAVATKWVDWLVQRDFGEAGA